MSISENRVKKQEVPVLNNDREKLFPGKVNVIVSTKTDKLRESAAEDRHQENSETGTQGAVRRIAVLYVQLCSGAEF